MLEKQKYEDLLAAHGTPQTLKRILEQIEEAIRNKNSQRAYELSLQATEAAPRDTQAWILRASLAPSLEERILCVNRLNELDPEHQDKHHIAFFAIQELLDRDPYLAYMEETENLYRVLQSDSRVLSIPKKRAVPAPSPHKMKDQLRASLRWLNLAVLGLMFAGSLTLIFAPLAAVSAVQTSISVGSHPVRVRSAIIVLLSVILFVIGLFFSFLLVLHIVG